MVTQRFCNFVDGLHEEFPAVAISLSLCVVVLNATTEYSAGGLVKKSKGLVLIGTLP